MKIDCKACHTPDGWSHMRDTLSFDHDLTAFALEGVHESTECKTCHSSNVFSEAPSDCVSCHTDIHQMTVGNDCVRCHTTQNWLVDNVPEIHEQNGFPLLGVHGALSCVDCHISESGTTFNRLGNDCISCHQSDFMATQSPDHEASGFSTNCLECHDPMGFDWTTALVDHGFFPLEQGHDIQDCAACHTTGSFADASPDCVSCHMDDYTATMDPNHIAAQFPTDCNQCHTIGGWTPATFDHDGQFFPIYSGTHNGVWNNCVECHPNPNNYAEFSCTNCHANPETDTNHDAVSGYIYENNACLVCHPNGLASEGFDHNTTNFPLTGGHVGVDCLACHANGYAGTPTECAACHLDDFNSTIDPDHADAGFPTDCIQCHTTGAWTPATFDHNATQFPLTGGHLGVDCLACHANGYAGTPTECSACHMDDFNSTNNPNHASAQFPSDCIQCHSVNAWEPSSFNHDDQYFPIYSGQHDNEWNTCNECHPNPNDYAVFTCTTCHTLNATNNDHDEVNGYIYDSNACLSCHPDGSN